MKPWTSLRGRLLTSATVCLVAFLGMMGFVLEEAFSSSARAAVEARLMQQIYGLLSVTEDSEMGLILPIELADPLMNQFDIQFCRKECEMSLYTVGATLRPTVLVVLQGLMFKKCLSRV